MVDNLFVPSSKQPSVIYCRLTDFYAPLWFFGYFFSTFTLLWPFLWFLKWSNIHLESLSTNCALSSNLGTFNVTLPLDHYCFFPFWGENKQTSQKPKNCKMQQILFLVTTSFRNLLGSWIQTFYIFHHLFSKRKGS